MDELTVEKFMGGWAIRNKAGDMVGFANSDWRAFLHECGHRQADNSPLENEPEGG